MPRATTSPAEGEEGFTLVEMVVTMMVMSLVATSVMMVAMRTFTDTSIITNRRDVLADGRIALDRLGKQLRQGESVDQGTSTASQIVFSSYVDGNMAQIIWRASGTAAPYTLEASTDGGTNWLPMLSELDSTEVFVYTAHGDVIDQVGITLALQTTTSTIPLTESVQLRNAQE